MLQRGGEVATVVVVQRKPPRVVLAIRCSFYRRVVDALYNVRCCCVVCLFRVLVSEKEGRMKEALRMMGLPDLVYHGSWLITFQAQVQYGEVQWLVADLRQAFR